MTETSGPVDRDPAVRAHRAHQGWWRETVLHRPPGPPTTKGSAYSTLPNCLPLEHEGLTAEEEGLNLMSDAARTYARGRCAQLEALGGLAEPVRLWRNLLSSQPLAFSVVGELRSQPTAAARVLADLTGLPVRRVVPLAAGLHTLDGLEAEWFPPRDRHTDDLSAFDAAACAELDDGSKLLVTIEVKYTDTFSRAPLEVPRYREALVASGFRESSAQGMVDAGGSQFLRSVLLTDSVRRKGVSGDGRGPERALAVALWTHRELFAACARQPELAAWAGRMRERYLLPEADA